jgi:hypothetical protein
MTTLYLNGGGAALLRMVALYRRRRRDLKRMLGHRMVAGAIASVRGATRREAIGS